MKISEYLIEQFATADRELTESIRRAFHIESNQVVNSEEYQKCNAQNSRKLAKDRYDVVLECLHETSGDSIELVNDKLIHIIVDHMPQGAIRQLLGPVFTRQQ